LDEELLNDVFETSPEKFQAVYKSLYTIEQSSLGVSFGFTSQPPEGVYNFVYDAASETATINGQALSLRRNSEGQQEFYRLTGDFDGITIKVLEGAPVDSEVYIGVSLVDKLSKYFEGVLGKQGEILAKETYFREKATEYIEALSDLDERAVVLEARELKRFAKMEQMVTQLKSTGEYITTMMDAWSKSD
jgi:flagellar hook-associated protein 2